MYSVVFVLLIKDPVRETTNDVFVIIICQPFFFFFLKSSFISCLLLFFYELLIFCNQFILCITSDVAKENLLIVQWMQYLVIFLF